MFEKIDRLTETVAAELCVSRRGFLGRVGQGGLVLLGAMAGLFGVPKDAFAYYPNPPSGEECCDYVCSGGPSTCLHKKNNEPCPPPPAGCSLYQIRLCREC